MTVPIATRILIANVRHIGLSKLDLTTFYFYLSKITSNLPEIYLSKSRITS